MNHELYVILFPPITDTSGMSIPPVQTVHQGDGAMVRPDGIVGTVDYRGTEFRMTYKSADGFGKVVHTCNTTTWGCDA